MSNYKRKGRQAATQGRSYWLYGAHAVEAALANPRRTLRRLVIGAHPPPALLALAHARGISAQTLPAAELVRLLPEGAVHQNVAAEVAPLPERTLEEVITGESAKPMLLLDQVTDPHNVGAILRSAAAFGVGAVIATRDHAPQESAVLAKAASGALEVVPLIAVVNLSQCMQTLKEHGYWCIGLSGEAPQAIGSAKLGRKTALVLGAEGKGLRRLTAERCDLLVKLPMAPVMESLNVSNAAAVALYALIQQNPDIIA